MENLFLVLRVVVSLAVVLGLLYVLRRRLVPRAGAGQRRAINVVARQGIGPKAAAVLIDVQGRRYLLGVADQSVSVLDSFDAPADADDDATARRGSVKDPGTASGHDGGTPADGNGAGDGGRLFALNLDDVRLRHRGETDTSATAPATEPASPLAGSILSAQTWRQAATALRRGRSS